MQELIDTHGVDGDDQATARKILAALRVPRHASDLLTPILAKYLADKIRKVVRQTEKDVRRPSPFRPLGAATPPPAHHVFNLQLTGAFLSSPLTISRKGDKTTWGEATLAQLRTKRDGLKDLRQSIDATERTVASAIAMIEATPGAACLNDVAKATEAAA